MEPTRKTREFVRADGGVLTAARCVRDAPWQVGNWRSQQTLLVAGMARRVLLGFDFLRHDAKSGDPERRKTQMRELRTDRPCVRSISSGACGAASAADPEKQPTTWARENF